MDLYFLTDELLNAIKKIDTDLLYEIRLRSGYPVKINLKGEYYYLSANGITLLSGTAIVINESDLQKIVDQITENSLYAYNDYLKQGFLTSKDGVRIGVAGECVFSNGNISTIKNLSSLNIRIPHEVKDCSKSVFEKILNDDGIFNSLLVSPPFCGKTTLLKDLVRKINAKNKQNLLLIDERGEFSKINGENVDVIKYSNKRFAFEYALRSLSPNVVVTDELCDEEDWKFVKNAANSGVKVVASVHSGGIEQLVKKDCFSFGVFERYFVINKKNGYGNLESVYDFNLKKI